MNEDVFPTYNVDFQCRVSFSGVYGLWMVDNNHSKIVSFSLVSLVVARKKTIYIHFEDGRPTVIVESQVAIVVFAVCVGIINNWAMKKKLFGRGI